MSQMENNEIIGLIPAAGKGIRLGLPYPKELFPVIRNNRYKPVSQFIVDTLTAAKVEHIVFVINSSKHQLLDFYGDGHRFNCNISYVVQEIRVIEGDSTSPGLAHALDSAYHLIQGKEVFFGMADTIIKPMDIFKRAFGANRNTEYDVILILFRTNRPEKFGMVDLDRRNYVLKIVDKPRKTKLDKMWGCIIWRPSFTEHLHDCIRNRKISDFAEIMNAGIESGLVFRGIHIPNSIYLDLGTYDEIKEIDRRL